MMNKQQYSRCSREIPPNLIRIRPFLVDFEEVDTTGHNGFTKRNEPLLNLILKGDCFDSLGPKISFVNNIYVL